MIDFDDRGTVTKWVSNGRIISAPLKPYQALKQGMFDLGQLYYQPPCEDADKITRTIDSPSYRYQTFEAQFQPNDDAPWRWSMRVTASIDNENTLLHRMQLERDPHCNQHDSMPVLFGTVIGLIHDGTFGLHEKTTAGRRAVCSDRSLTRHLGELRSLTDVRQLEIVKQVGAILISPSNYDTYFISGQDKHLYLHLFCGHEKRVMLTRGNDYSASYLIQCQ
jgi:hypothetical protein